MSDESKSAPKSWPATAAETMSLAERRREFGKMLRSVRENQRVSVIALAQGTRISSNFIEALENGQFERLPGEVFGRGFLRNLARALGMSAADSAALLDIYNQCCIVEEVATPKKPKSSAVARNISRHEKAEIPVEQKLEPQVSPANGKRRYPSLQLGLSISTSTWLKGLAAAALLVVVVGGLYRSRGVIMRQLAQGPQPAAVVQPITAQRPEPVDMEPDSFDDQESTTSNVAPTVAAAPAVIVPAKPAVVAVQKQVSKSATAPVTAPSVVAEKAPVAASVGLKAPAGSTDKDVQTLEFVVTETVKIRLSLDQNGAVVKEFTPDTYKFTFSKTAELLVFDAAAVKINYNGKSLGSLGSKGRVRRLSFDAAPPEGEKF